MALPINIHDLITGKTVEWDRIEFKAGWNPEDVLHTMCAFANDVNNWGGGYLIIGIAEQEGMPILPPVGLKTNQIDKIQKELVRLTNTLDPFYSPVTEPVEFNGKTIFIIWVPGGQTRPYKAPGSLSVKGVKQYYIRRGSTTVKANHAEVKQLMELADYHAFWRLMPQDACRCRSGRIFKTGKCRPAVLQLKSRSILSRSDHGGYLVQKRYRYRIYRAYLQRPDPPPDQGYPGISRE